MTTLQEITRIREEFAELSQSVDDLFLSLSVEAALEKNSGKLRDDITELQKRFDAVSTDLCESTDDLNNGLERGNKNPE